MLILTKITIKPMLCQQTYFRRAESSKKNKGLAGYQRLSLL
jgi:hypothetical protein